MSSTESTCLVEGHGLTSMDDKRISITISQGYKLKEQASKASVIRQQAEAETGHKQQANPLAVPHFIILLTINELVKFRCQATLNLLLYAIAGCRLH